MLSTTSTKVIAIFHAYKKIGPVVTASVKLFLLGVFFDEVDEEGEGAFGHAAVIVAL